jgi:hypothetical protein
MPVLKQHHVAVVAAGFFSACFCIAAAGQSAPGEDPIFLENKISIQMLPLGGAPRSTSINYDDDMPAWQRAKLSRYEAKAFSGNTGNILTEKDVVHSSTTDGFRTTCTQSIGSTTGTTSLGAKPTEQVVVLRGDVVNICN